MQRLLHYTLSSGFICFTLFACSGTTTPSKDRSSDSDRPTDPISVEDAPAEFAKVWCAGLRHCCTPSNPLSEERCAYNADYFRGQLLDELETPGTYFDGALMRRCMNALLDRWVGKTCDLPENNIDDSLSIKECALIERSFVHGPKKLGETCNKRIDCIPSELGTVGCKDLGSGAPRKICVAYQEVLGEGEKCEAVSSSGVEVRLCKPEFSCQAGVCTRRLCGTESCDKGSYCTAVGGGKTGCLPQLDLGESCKSDVECRSLECDKNNTCARKIDAFCANPTGIER